VFRAGDREVREVMTPRTEVEFLEASTTASRAAKQVAESNWSRFPVVARDEDDVIGFVHVRDLLLRNEGAGRFADEDGVAEMGAVAIALRPRHTGVRRRPLAPDGPQGGRPRCRRPRPSAIGC